MAPSDFFCFRNIDSIYKNRKTTFWCRKQAAAEHKPIDLWRSNIKKGCTNLGTKKNYRFVHPFLWASPSQI